MHSPLLRSWSACHGAEEADNEYLLSPAKKPKHLKPQKKIHPCACQKLNPQVQPILQKLFQTEALGRKSNPVNVISADLASSTFWFCKCNHSRKFKQSLQVGQSGFSNAASYSAGFILQSAAPKTHTHTTQINKNPFKNKGYF